MKPLRYVVMGVGDIAIELEDDARGKACVVFGQPQLSAALHIGPPIRVMGVDCERGYDFAFAEQARQVAERLLLTLLERLEYTDMGALGRQPVPTGWRPWEE